MSRPGGNPELNKHQFDQKYRWDEPCTAQLGLRLPPSLSKELKQIDNWQEKIRHAIADLVEEELQNRQPN